MDRRSFLIYAGSILTAAFVDKANWFIRNKNAVAPLVQLTQQMTKLYFVPQGTEFELRLESPDFGFEDLTYREVCGRYYDVYLPKDEPVTLSQFSEIYPDRGLTPKMLDKQADLMDYLDAWGRNNANKAKAYWYLHDLDLFGPEQAEALRKGDLCFIDGVYPGKDYLGVTSNDPVTASLLQARLLELVHYRSVEISQDLYFYLDGKLPLGCNDNDFVFKQLSVL